MSFSFSLRARTVAAALAIAAAEMDKVVQSQPTHTADRDTVLATVKGQLGHVEKAAEGQHVLLSVSGSVSWRGVGPGTATPASDDFAITGANVSVNVYLIPADADGNHYPPVREV